MTVAEEEGLSDQEGRKADDFAAVARTRYVSARHLQPGAAGAADTLLAAARDLGALVVMGAYGHSRLREWVFGGFTSTFYAVLKSRS